MDRIKRLRELVKQLEAIAKLKGITDDGTNCRG